MNQGCFSTVEKQGNRLYKTITSYGDYGPFEECKILKYVSTLGTEFPQNVVCEGIYKLSYNYIEGITLKEYLEQSSNPFRNQVEILIQLLNINKKLMNVGIYLYDQGLCNFILDHDGIIHVIDFGDVENPHREQLSKPNTFIEPLMEYTYINIEEYDYRCLIRAVNGWYRTGLIGNELYDIFNDFFNIDELINILKMY